MTIQSTEIEISDEEIYAEGSKVPNNDLQLSLIRYLMDLLEWLYRAEGWYIGGDLPLVYTRRRWVAPDIMVVKGLKLGFEDRAELFSYRLYHPNRPVPNVIFEILSKKTWRADVDLAKKPTTYQQMGVREYFIYDPHLIPLWPNKELRLIGYRYENGERLPIPSVDGRLWSQELDSWLVPDGTLLRLYDRNMERRLTATEAARVAADVERQAQEQKYAALLERLRQAGIDPDKYQG